MSRRQESISYILVHDCPWWVSVILSGVVYVLMKEVAPHLFQENSIMAPIMKAAPSVAWMGALLLLAFAGLNLFVRLMKRH
ncbi:MAG: hypothetical protein U1F71_19665 [Verrucomicrobiaceae bacterium]